MHGIAPVGMDAFHVIQVPKEGMMYHHLMQTAKQVIASVQGSHASYRRVMACFNQLLSGGGAIGNPETAEGFVSVRAPQPKPNTRRGRASNAETLNQSALKQKRPANGAQKNSSAKSCKKCRAHNIIATDHGSGSRCPLNNVQLYNGQYHIEAFNHRRTRLG
jgi:hypothetical protein